MNHTKRVATIDLQKNADESDHRATVYRVRLVLDQKRLAVDPKPVHIGMLIEWMPPAVGYHFHPEHAGTAPEGLKFASIDDFYKAIGPSGPSGIENKSGRTFRASPPPCPNRVWQDAHDTIHDEHPASGGDEYVHTDIVDSLLRMVADLALGNPVNPAAPLPDFICQRLGREVVKRVSDSRFDAVSSDTEGGNG